MAAKDLITRIILKGQADPSLEKAFNKATKLSSSTQKNLQKYADTAKKVGKVGVSAIATGLVASAKAAIDYESAFAGVMKTVDETATTTYADISDGIIEMSKRLPTTASEIAAVAETAGQLGIGADDVLKFSETMINLGETTNLSSEEAASSIAKMFNIMGTDMSNVDRFGSTIVALGNNAATTESDIVNMASRIAAGGKQIGLTEAQILALSTTLSSVGLEAEGGGTAVSTVLAQIDKDVAKNSDTLATWADLAGMSTKKFADLWEKDAYGAFQKVIGGMGDSSKGGENLNLILEELGITGIRSADTMKRLSNASELMGDMTNLANQAWSENSALSDEAAKRYETVASKISVLKNHIVSAAITIGNALLPHIEKAIAKMQEIDWEAVGQKVVDCIDWVVEHFDEIKVALMILGTMFVSFKVATFINTMAEVVTSVKKVNEVLGITAKIKDIPIFTKLKGFSFKGITSSIGGLFTKIKGMGVVSKLASGGMKLLSGAFTFLTGPIGITIAAIAAVVAVFVVLWKKCDWFREFWINLWEKIKVGAGKAGEWLKNFFTVTIPNAFNTFVTWCSQLPSKIGTFFSNMYQKAKTWTVNLVNTVVTWFKQLPTKIGTWLSNTVNKVTTWGSNLWAKAKEIGSNFISSVANFFSELPYKVGYALGFVIGKVILFGQKLWNFATTKIPQFISSVVNFFKQLPSKIWTWLVNAYTKVVAWGTNIITTAKQKVSAFLNAVITYVRQLPGKIWTWLTNAAQKVVAWGTRIVTVGRQKVQAFLTAVVSFFRQLPGRVWTFLTSAAQKVVSWGTRIVTVGKQKAQAFITAVINFVKQLPSKIWTWLTNAASKVVTWGSQLAAKGKAAATKLFNAVVNKVKEIPGKMLSIGKNIVQGLWNGIKNAKDWLVGKVKSFASGITDGIKDALGINSPSVVMEKLFKWVPVGAGEGIINNAKYAVKAVQSMGAKVAASASKISPTIQTKVATVGEKIRAFASGGTVTTPQMAVVGDAPETIVPHGNTPRNRSLLQEAARGVGASVGGNKMFNFTFAPVINGGNVEENRKMLQEEEAEFERRMDAYFAKKGRLAF